MKRTIYTQIKEGLAMASQLIITAPVRLPPKVVAAAKYVSLGIALLDTIITDDRNDTTQSLSGDTGTGGMEDPDDGD